MKGRRDSSSILLIKEEQRKLSEVYAQQEVRWRQRSKQLWLREGDSNSKFFHASVRKRRVINKISSLQNNDGLLVDWNSGLETIVTDYFTELFSTAPIDWQEVVDSIDTKISEEQNNTLISPVEEKEVKEALFHMHPDKSPGPAGITPGFYQKFWKIVKNDVIQVVRQFFEEGRINEQLVNTNIALIPKKKQPQAMTDIRPISLCNVIYKVISKVLANRLKKLIDQIISDEQSAFIPGRLITDNVMIAHELVYYLERKTEGIQGWMALKIDMSKSYDRV